MLEATPRVMGVWGGFLRGVRGSVRDGLQEGQKGFQVGPGGSQGGGTGGKGCWSGCSRRRSILGRKSIPFLSCSGTYKYFWEPIRYNPG